MMAFQLLTVNQKSLALFVDNSAGLKQDKTILFTSLNSSVINMFSYFFPENMFNFL